MTTTTATNVIHMRGAQAAPKSVRSSMETLLLTIGIIDEWKLPPFQREYKENQRVRDIAEELKSNGGMISGVITLATLDRAPKVHYLLDGQHRMGAVRLSGLPEVIADVRICEFETMTEMGSEFVRLNQKIRPIQPDDVLRALEGEIAALRTIRRHCPFVGYGNIRRGPASPLLSMSSLIRSWRGSHAETPSMSASGQSASEQAADLSDDEVESLVAFLNIIHKAWKDDPASARLWASLNLCMCMWVYRRLVMDRERGLRRYAVLTPDQFMRCMMSVAAAEDYVAWLLGRAMRERDRGPCYTRLKGLIVARLREMNLDNLKMPSPAWVGK